MKIVFIVDDNETNRVAAKEALEGVYKTYALPSALKMFQLAENIRPDLILLDVDMPEIDGLETVKFIRADPHLNRVPIIMFTAYSVEVLVSSCLEAGANDFVIKPFNKAILLRRIAKQLSQ